MDGWMDEWTDGQTDSMCVFAHMLVYITTHKAMSVHACATV